MKISIIIPAHNEEKRIGRTLIEYGSYFDRFLVGRGWDYEILVVINATTDSTEKVVRTQKKKNRRINYLVFKQGGKGFAVLEGFKKAISADNELIGFVDADMATPPEAFFKLIKEIGNYDGIIGDRWSKESKIGKKQTKLRRLASRIFNFITKSLFFMTYQDTQCGAKIFRNRVIKKIVNKVYITNWAFDVNLLYLCKREGYLIKQFPTEWYDKNDSKISMIRSSLKMFFGIVRLRLLYSPFRKVIKIYDALPEGLKVNHRFTE